MLLESTDQLDGSPCILNFAASRNEKTLILTYYILSSLKVATEN